MSPPGPVRARLLAHPAGHSLSPVMHEAGLAALGIPGRYEAADVPPAGLAAALEDLRASDLWGANLSIPHKEAALALADELDPAAAALGAVNTLVREGARLRGLNTDAPGFLRALSDAGWSPGGPALVIGAGGAGRAVAWALARAGVEVAVWNRSPERARALAAELGLGRVTDAGLPDAARSAGLVVNATSVGLNDPRVTPLAAELLPEAGWVCDIVYRPLETRLLREARARGLRAVDGLGMLVHQGALALEAWLDAHGHSGARAPAGVMREAAFKALEGTAPSH